MVDLTDYAQTKIFLTMMGIPFKEGGIDTLEAWWPGTIAKDRQLIKVVAQSSEVVEGYQNFYVVFVFKDYGFEYMIIAE